MTTGAMSAADKGKRQAVLIMFVGTVLLLCSGGGSGAEDRLVVADFSEIEDIEAGERFLEWVTRMGWDSPLGEPRYFSISGGRLHMVSRPGPAYDNRHLMAMFQREKLIDSIENKVLLRLTNPDFRLDPQRWNRLCFTMAPVVLPGEEADLRDSDKNDSAFYLITSFDTRRFDIGGYAIPHSLGYVWANRPWGEKVGKDKDYSQFLRFIAIGWGESDQPGLQRYCRRIDDDFRAAYPGYEKVPDLIEVSLKIDSNTLGGTAESMVGRIWFEEQDDAGEQR